MSNVLDKNETENNIVIYQTQDGQTKIDVKIENDSVWLTQKQMVELLQSSKSNISEHIAHIFEETPMFSSVSSTFCAAS